MRSFRTLDPRPVSAERACFSHEVACLVLAGRPKAVAEIPLLWEVKKGNSLRWIGFMFCWKIKKEPTWWQWWSWSYCDGDTDSKTNGSVLPDFQGTLAVSGDLLSLSILNSDSYQSKSNPSCSNTPPWSIPQNLPVRYFLGEVWGDFPGVRDFTSQISPSHRAVSS